MNAVNGPDAPVSYDLHKAQYEAIDSGVGLELATQLIRQKIEGCRTTLQTFWKSADRDRAIANQDGALIDIKQRPISYDEIRWIEARAASSYFAAWSEQPIRWKGTGRRPISNDWHRCAPRMGILENGRNRHAAHPVAALLNYAYSILKSELRIAINAHGLDPCVGYLHTMRLGRMSLVYDLMEPLRPIADKIVLDFVRSETFSPADFDLNVRGACRLHPQLARRFVRLIKFREEANETLRHSAKALGI